MLKKLRIGVCGRNQYVNIKMNLFTAKMYNLSHQFLPGIADKTVLI